MLHSVREVIGYRLDLSDAEMGHVADFFFHDDSWRIRYLVAKTKPWLFGRKVLIVPMALRDVHQDSRIIEVAQTRDEVKRAPDVDTDKPVSRQHESSLHDHYDWVPYWAPHAIALSSTIDRPEPELRDDGTNVDDPKLRSVDEIVGYSVIGSDGDSGGKVDDFIVDDDGWVLRHAIVRFPLDHEEHPVAIGTGEITQVNWNEQAIHLPFAKRQLLERPVFDVAGAENGLLAVHDDR